MITGLRVEEDVLVSVEEVDAIGDEF